MSSPPPSPPPLDDADASKTCRVVGTVTVPHPDPNRAGDFFVEVIAPSDLPEGYTFDATYEGTIFPVVVPVGGVRKDQRFMVPFVAPQRPQEASRYAPTLQDGIVTNSSDFGEGDHSTRVVGAWKDSLFSCCDHGPFHPHVWMSFCCRPLAIAMVMMRTGQNWAGRQASTPEEAKGTFTTVGILFIVYFFSYEAMMNLYDQSVLNSDNQYMGQYQVQYQTNGSIRLHAIPSTTSLAQQPISGSAALELTVAHLIYWFFWIYVLVIMMRTRRYIRQIYRIPELRYMEGNGDLEDCCLSFWCPCCTVAQMMRQTADYHTQEGACCTENGLEPSRGETRPLLRTATATPEAVVTTATAAASVGTMDATRAGNRVYPGLANSGDPANVAVVSV